MPTQAELLKREREQEDMALGNAALRHQQAHAKDPKPSRGSNRGKSKDALMSELNIKRLKMNQTTDSNQ